MMQLTMRDHAMLDWLKVVRLADVEAIRWALPGLGGTGDSAPVTSRKAQQWVAKMVAEGLVEKARPMFQHGSIVWAAPTFRPPDLYRQTARHEVLVARASARYLARGYRWARDRKPVTLQDHQADGVATALDGSVELVEVELTSKSSSRYRAILNDHAHRLGAGGVTRVVYLCNRVAANAVLREADRNLFRELRPRLVAVDVYDDGGDWIGADDAPWVEHLMAPAPMVSAPGLWDAGTA